MHRLAPEKLVNIIYTEVLDEQVIAVVRKRGASGYTLLRARGAGTSGLQSGVLDSDTNTLLQVIIPPARLPGLLDDLERLLKKGYHLTVYVSDVAVLGREKYETPMG